MAKKLRVALVFDDSMDRNDGVQQYVRTIGTWLHDQGHYVKYLVGETTEAGEIQSQVHSLARNFKVRGNQNILSLPLPSSVKKLKQVIKEEQFDVVHVQMPYNPLMSGRLIKRLPKSTRVVGTFHIVGASWMERIGSKLLSRMQHFGLKRFDEIVSVSTAAREFSAKYFSLHTRVIPNAVKTTIFRSAKPKKHLRPAELNVLFLGRLVERKGADHLLKALSIVKQVRPKLNFLAHICSDGPMRSELEEYVANNNLHDNVIFHGFIDENEKPDFLASADISVFPSTGGESFGIVLVEAMASGYAVVLGGDNEGYRTVLDDREEYLFDPTDHQALAEKILHYHDDKKANKSARVWQKNRARKYDVSKVGPQIVDLYNKD